MIDALLILFRKEALWADNRLAILYVECLVASDRVHEILIILSDIIIGHLHLFKPQSEIKITQCYKFPSKYNKVSNKFLVFFL